MISLKIVIPFGDMDKQLFHFDRLLTKNKAFEVEISFDFRTIVEFSMWFVKYSHAGVVIDLGLLGFTCCAQFYDVRHWNHEANRFETDEEVIEQQREYDEEQKKRERYKEWLKTQEGAENDQEHATGTK